MRKTQKVQYLEEVPLFANLSKKELGEVASHVDLAVVDANTKLTVEGRPGQQFGIIVSGSAVVRRNDRQLADLGPGDFFGEMALLLRQPSSATVSTTADSTLLVMHRRDFDTVLNRVPVIGKKLATGLAARLLEADRKLVT